MTDGNKRGPRPGGGDDQSVWPIVSPDDIGVAEFDWDLAYMGVYLRLEICNYSPYLVREAEISVLGYGRGTQRTVTTREIKAGPLFPGVYHHEEVGIGEPGGIGGVGFRSIMAHAVRLTPPALMAPADAYPSLIPEILDVAVDEEGPDLRRYEGDGMGQLRPAQATNISIRVRNDGQAVVERARLKLSYLEAAGAAAAGVRPMAVAEWIFDMPRADWNPYRLPDALEAACDPADPLPPGAAHEFVLVHYGGGPHDWARRRDAVSIEVCGLKLRA
jgi:hypothetical protein